MRRNRLLELDSLRGLSSLAIVVYHYFYRFDSLYTHKAGLLINWSYLGVYGVKFFFIISGFVIFWSVDSLENNKDFIISRFSRLFPVFWFCCIFTFLTVAFFGLPGREVSFSNAFFNLFMLHELFHIPHIDGVYWTLTIELIFYFWIFIFLVFKKIRKIDIFLFILTVLSVLQKIYIIEFNVLLNKILLLNFAPFFLSGICFFKIKNGIDIKLSIFFLLAALSSVIYIYSKNAFLIVVFIHTIFLFCIFGKLKFLRFKFFVFIGGISYSLYLIHQNIGYIIINFFYTNNLEPLLGIFTAFILSLVLATIIHLYIELPFLYRIRRFYQSTKEQ
ncbi:MAG: acyltransferase family protein [Bacillota bacterium]